MNKTNNRRNRKSVEAIWKAYFNLVVSRNDPATITVSDICKKAGINRTTFYAHYLDIDDLLTSIYDWMMNECLSPYSDEIGNGRHSYDFLKLFRHIYENQIFYKIYFKLGFDFRNAFLKNASSFDITDDRFKDVTNIEYHIEFFSAGITAIIRKWLDSGCKETPETMEKILEEEYMKKVKR